MKLSAKQEVRRLASHIAVAFGIESKKGLRKRGERTGEPFPWPCEGGAGIIGRAGDIRLFTKCPGVRKLRIVPGDEKPIVRMQLEISRPLVALTIMRLLAEEE